jgi:FixJ family two-component response regulator
MGKGSNFSAIILFLERKLADAGIEIPTVFITAHCDIPMSVEFLTKPFRAQDLLDASVVQLIGRLSHCCQQLKINGV